MTSKVIYKGNLRTSAVHLKSNSEIYTDAPIDNNGKGEMFSPTDLVATALASCMLTIVGIKANSSDFDIEGSYAEVTKVMGSNPRRIGKIEVNLFFENHNYTEKQKEIIKKSALNCPVAKSLSEKIEQVINFYF